MSPFVFCYVLAVTILHPFPRIVNNPTVLISVCFLDTALYAISSFQLIAYDTF